MIIFFIILCSSAQTIEVNGLVEGVWNADTVRVTGNIEVPAEKKLIIEPGVYVHFTGYYRMFVLGTLHAIGNKADSIIFTIEDPEEFEDFTVTNGGWRGIFFRSAGTDRQDSSILDFCSISYAKGSGTDSLDRYCGAVYADEYNNLRISNSTLYRNYAQKLGGAIGIYRSDVLIQKCLIKDNLTSITTEDIGFGAALAASESTFIMEHCSISNNRCVSVGGALFISACKKAQIRHNIFTENIGSTGGAVFILDSDNIIFYDNLLYKNTGIYFGGAIAGKQSYVKLINCTITENTGGQGGAFYISNETLFDLFNCIVYDNVTGGNGPEFYIQFITSTCNFFNCNIKGGKEAFGGGASGELYWGIYDESNIDTDPLFIYAESYDYRLADHSPCIDKGSVRFIENDISEYDLAGNARIVNDLIDIGAYENQNNVAIPRTPKANHLYAYCSDRMLIFESEKELKKVAVFDISGRLLTESFPNVRNGSIPLPSRTNRPNMIIVTFTLRDNSIITKKLLL